jgi:hypothetical protein
MNCQDVYDKLGLWPDGSEGIDDFPTFMRHVDECPSCQLQLEEMDRIVAMLADLPAPVPSAKLENQLMRRFYQEQPVKRRRNPHLLYVASGVAAVFLFGFAMIVRYNAQEGQMLLAYEQSAMEDVQVMQTTGEPLEQTLKNFVATGEADALNEAVPAEEAAVPEASPKTDAAGSGESLPATDKQSTLSTPVLPEPETAVMTRGGSDGSSEVELFYRGRLTKLTIYWQDGNLYLPVVEIARQLSLTVELNTFEQTAVLNDQKIKLLSRHGQWYCSESAFISATQLSLTWKGEYNQLVIQ